MYCKEKCSDWKMCERKSCKKAPSADSAASQLGFKRDFEDDQWSFFHIHPKMFEWPGNKSICLQNVQFHGIHKRNYFRERFFICNAGACFEVEILANVKTAQG